MMRILFATFGVWIGAMTCLAGDKETEVAAERARFQGTWQLVSAESDGKKTPEDVVAKIRVIISGTTHSVRLGDEVLAHDVGFVIDPTTVPKSTTDTINDGPNKGKQIRGIYRLEGDTLTSCVGPVDGPRPVEFTAKAGSGQTLRVFRREKKDDGTKAEAVRAEQKRFEGTWKFVSMEVDGRSIPEANFKDSRLILEGNRFTAREKEEAKGTYDVDPTVIPKTIDITLNLGPDRRATILGIYELEGDTYKICSARPGRPRPKEFSSKSGSGQGVQVMAREKP
jgi:uncharacterized protein (TIGR03067 family)